ncbi:hypothetical protein MLPF_3362 [Mycobacterium lepromatosis]|nr:hypothetical protein MLPF_3362 [Mycobacterium lepromatosis]
MVCLSRYLVCAASKLAGINRRSSDVSAATMEQDALVVRAANREH